MTPIRVIARQLSLAGVVLLLLLAVSVAGCGSKKSSGSSGGSSASGATTKTYRPGEFCSKKKEAVYAAQGLKCRNGHLKKK